MFKSVFITAEHGTVTVALHCNLYAYLLLKINNYIKTEMLETIYKINIS